MHAPARSISILDGHILGLTSNSAKPRCGGLVYVRGHDDHVESLRREPILRAATVCVRRHRRMALCMEDQWLA